MISCLSIRIVTERASFTLQPATSRRSNSPTAASVAAPSNSKTDKPQPAQEDHDNDKDKKRNAKHKWVPLEIDLKAKGENHRRRNDRSHDVQSTVSDGDRDWRAESLNSYNHNSGRNGNPRPASAAPRGRGRARGGRRGPFSRQPRTPNDTDLGDGPDFGQVRMRSRRAACWVGHFIFCVSAFSTRNSTGSSSQPVCREPRSLAQAAYCAGTEWSGGECRRKFDVADRLDFVCSFAHRELLRPVVRFR